MVLQQSAPGGPISTERLLPGWAGRGGCGWCVYKEVPAVSGGPISQARGGLFHALRDRAKGRNLSDPRMGFSGNLWSVPQQVFRWLGRRPWSQPR